MLKFCPLPLIVLCVPTTLSALTIQMDYRYDTNNFFDTPEKRAAMQAVADRLGSVITQELNAVTVGDDGRDVRISFSHPGLGGFFQVSAAGSRDTDAIYQPEASDTQEADEYRGEWSIPADTIIVYAGGRSLSSAGSGGTGIGRNFTSTLADPVGLHNRGFNTGFENLPVWGGSITFDSGRNWSFEPGAPPSGQLDFYSIALHELGHVVGLGTSWNDFQELVVGDRFTGPNATTASSGDTGGGLLIADPTVIPESGGRSRLANPHWEDGTYQSEIFSGGNPNYAGTVGAGNPQDLLMEPIANFTSQARRFELTRADVGALQDIGWDVISEPMSNSLESWRLTFFDTVDSEGNAENSFDFDDDGLPNLLEYALDTDPTVQDFNQIRSVVLADGSFNIEFPFNRNAIDVNLFVEASDSLQGWSVITQSNGAELSSVSPSVRVVEAWGDDFQVGFSQDVASGEVPQFLRLRAIELPQ